MYLSKLNIRITTAIVILILFLIPIKANADSNPYILLDSDKGVSALISDVNFFSSNELGLKLMKTGSGNTKKVYINKIDYVKLNASDKRDLMEHTLNLVSGSSLGGRDKSRLYNFIQEQDEGTAMVVRQLSTDVTTDLASASDILRPFTSPISIFLGVSCIVIFFCLAVSITIDLVFLTIPVFQAFVMRDDSNRPKYISQEAWDALLLVESKLGTGQASSIWGIYFKSRSKTMVIVGITLGYLIGGEVFDLAIFIVDLFQRVFS